MIVNLPNFNSSSFATRKPATLFRGRAVCVSCVGHCLVGESVAAHECSISGPDLEGRFGFW